MSYLEHFRLILSYIGRCCNPSWETAVLSRLLTAASSGAARRFSSSGLHGAAVGCTMGPTYAHALSRADATYQPFQFVCLNRVEYAKDVDGQVCAVRV
jgi:hypothetical protein